MVSGSEPTHRKPVVDNFGLLCLNHRLLWSIEAHILSYLAFQAGSRYIIVGNLSLTNKYLSWVLEPSSLIRIFVELVGSCRCSWRPKDSCTVRSSIPLSLGLRGILAAGLGLKLFSTTALQERRVCYHGIQGSHSIWSILPRCRLPNSSACLRSGTTSAEPVLQNCRNSQERTAQGYLRPKSTAEPTYPAVAGPTRHEACRWHHTTNSQTTLALRTTWRAIGS